MYAVFLTFILNAVRVLRDGGVDSSDRASGPNQLAGHVGIGPYLKVLLLLHITSTSTATDDIQIQLLLGVLFTTWPNASLDVRFVGDEWQ